MFNPIRIFFQNTLQTVTSQKYYQIELGRPSFKNVLQFWYRFQSIKKKSNYQNFNKFQKMSEKRPTTESQCHFQRLSQINSCPTEVRRCPLDVYLCLTEVNWCPTEVRWCPTEVRWCPTEVLTNVDEKRKSKVKRLTTKTIHLQNEISSDKRTSNRQQKLKMRSLGSAITLFYC